jgi:hypothetical protein
MTCRPQRALKSAAARARLKWSFSEGVVILNSSLSKVVWLAVGLATVFLTPSGQAQQPSDFLGTWVAVGKNSGESFTARPDSTYEQAARFPQAGVEIYETGQFQSLGNTLTLYPVRKTYRRGSVSQPDSLAVRTYAWQVLYDSAAQRRVLQMSNGNTTTEYREDSPSASPVDREAAAQLPNVRSATVCQTPRMTCAIEVRGVHRPGDTCACSNKITGLAMDYGRAR